MWSIEKLRNEYTIRGYETESCGNLVCVCVLKKVFRLLQHNGWKSMIVPHCQHTALIVWNLSAQSYFIVQNRKSWVCPNMIASDRENCLIDLRSNTLAIYTLLTKFIWPSDVYIRISNIIDGITQFRSHLFAVAYTCECYTDLRLKIRFPKIADSVNVLLAKLMEKIISIFSFR